MMVVRCYLGDMGKGDVVEIGFSVTTTNTSRKYSAEVNSDILDGYPDDNSDLKTFGGSLGSLMLLSMAALVVGRRKEMIVGLSKA
jgi:hypothetical protein